MMTDIKRIDGVDSAYADKFSKVGITTVEALLEKCQSWSDLDMLTKKTGISIKRILKWVFLEQIRDVEIHYQNLMATVREVTNTNNDEDNLHNLLNSYHELADQFYNQFKSSLFDDLTNTKQQIQSLNEISRGDKNPAVSDLTQKKEFAFTKLLANSPNLMQKCLGKLEEEWNRVYQVMVANQAAHRQENKDFIERLNKLVGWAAYDVGINTEDIHTFVAPQLGDSYALQFFNYTDNLMALTLPPSSLRAPWEWSVLWHEMAGYKIRQLDSSGFENINNFLQATSESKILFRQAYLALKEVSKENVKWLAEETFWEEFSDKKEELLSHMLIAASQVWAEPQERIIDWLEEGIELTVPNLEQQLQILQERLWTRSIEDYETAMESGWCEDWIKELFEDAFSIRAFGSPFLAILDNILKRYPDSSELSDHPPRKVRLQVAKKYLRLLEGETIAEDETNLDDFISNQIARQINKYMPLLAKQPSTFTEDSAKIYELNDLSNKISKWLERRDSRTHIVTPGESLTRITLKYGVQASEISIIETPSLEINGTVPGINVSVTPKNFPDGTELLVTMGKMGTKGINGFVIKKIKLEGALQTSSHVIEIPEELSAEKQIAVRVESNNGYYAYNWFYNTTSDNDTLSLTIIDSVSNQSATVLFSNFPPNQTFEIMMGEKNSSGINGIIVETLYSGTGGTFQGTFSIPNQLHELKQIAIRAQTNHIDPFYAYNWFYNKTPTVDPNRNYEEDLIVGQKLIISSKPTKQDLNEILGLEIPSIQETAVNECETELGQVRLHITEAMNNYQTQNSIEIESINFKDIKSMCEQLVEEETADKLKSIIKEFINDKTYHELLDISFFEADHALGKFILNVRNRLNENIVYYQKVSYKKSPNLPSVKRGEIIYEIGGIHKITTKLNWNRAFPNFPID